MVSISKINNNANPDVSVITVCKNSETTITNTITSVAFQRHRNIEHIIIDGKSTDNTPLIIKKYASLDPRIRWVSEQDTGIYEAINKGIKMSNGNWIHVLNSGDTYLSTDSIAKIISDTDVDKFDMILTPIVFHTLGSDLKILAHSKYDKKLNYFEKFHHQGILIRKSFHDQYGLYDENYRIISDAIFNIKKSRMCRWIIIDQPIAEMVSGGISDKPSFLKIYENIVLILFYKKDGIHIKLIKISKLIIGQTIAAIRGIYQ